MLLRYTLVTNYKLTRACRSLKESRYDWIVRCHFDEVVKLLNHQPNMHFILIFYLFLSPTLKTLKFYSIPATHLTTYHPFTGTGNNFILKLITLFYSILFYHWFFSFSICVYLVPTPIRTYSQMSLQITQHREPPSTSIRRTWMRPYPWMGIHMRT